MDEIIRERPKLLTPGPTPVPLPIRRVALEEPIFHRSKDFAEIFLRCRQNLAKLFQTKNLPLILTSSGTGALESAVVNFTNPGDEVSIVVGGKFGERWQKLNASYQCVSDSIKVDEGSHVTVEQVDASLRKHNSPKVLFIQASETSTGIYHPIEQICDHVRRNFKDVIIVVDAVSAICAHDIKMDAWGIDVLISGSQKGFGVPPGLAFIAVSDRCWNQYSERPKFYFDLKNETKGQDDGVSAWTTATTLVQQLDLALTSLAAKGPEELASDHARMSQAARSAFQAAGIELFAKESPSHALTSFIPPKECDATTMQKHLRDHYRFQIAGGQGGLKGKILRLAHLGFFDDFDLITALTAIEKTLMDHKYSYDHGVIISTALKKLSL